MMRRPKTRQPSISSSLSKNRDRFRDGLGFTLIELLVGVLLLALAATGSIALFIAAAEQAQRAAERNEGEAAIEENIALVLQANDRFHCQVTPCTIATDDRNENEYAPLPGTAQFTNFENQCENNTLSASLVTLIDLLPDPGGIRQPANAEPLASGERPHHRYQVTWTAEGINDRTLTLTPTVSKWCP